MADKASRAVIVYIDGLARMIGLSHTNLHCFASLACCKESRAIIVYGDGLTRMIRPSHTNLHCFASLACCGFASLPNSPSSENEGGRALREFSELLDATNVSMGTEANIKGNHEIATVSERFMGMKAVIVTNDSGLQSFGTKLGLHALVLNDLIDGREASAGTRFLPLRLLGFQEVKISEVPQFDLAFIHIGAGEIINVVKDVDFINDFVGKPIHTTQPGTEGSRLHMYVIMSYGAVSSGDNDKFPISTSDLGYKPNLSLLVPCQSYTLKERKNRLNLRQYCPVLIAQWQNVVTRKDLVKSYSFEDFKKHGGNLVIPADRVIHEIAFKLWKAPKYGP